MADEKETRERLLESARKEFAEKGFMKASLQNICKNAGVTTGALYFFFKDKDELFRSIVEEPLHRVQDVMQQHYNFEKCALEKGQSHQHNEDEDASLQVIHLLYQYREDVLILLTRSQGSSLENIQDQFVDISEQHYRSIMYMAQPEEAQKVADSVYHWVAHMEIETFIYIITHIEKEEDALVHMKYSLRYMISGWHGLFLMQNEEL